MTLYPVTAFLTTVSALGIGAFVFAKNPRAAVNKRWGILNLSIALWSTFLAILFLSKNSEMGLMASRYLQLGANFIPITFFHFVLALLGMESEKRTWLKLGYGVTVGMALLGFSGFFIQDVSYQAQLSCYYPVAGPAYILYILMFFLYPGYAWLLMAKSLPRVPGLRSNQVKYVMVASTIGFLGGSSTFPLWYGIQIPPFGSHFVFLYTTIISVAIVRLRLMDINLAIRRTWVFSLVYALTLGLPLLVALTWRPKLEQAFGINWWVGLWFACAILTTAAHYVNQYFQKRTENRLLGEEHKAHGDLRFISQDMMRFLRESTLLKQIARRLVSVLNITHAAIYLTEGQDGRYRQKASRYYPPRKDSSLPEDLPATSTLARDLATVRIPRVKEELRLHQQALSANWREMAREMDLFKASVMIPAFHQRRFLGFLVLGDKRSGRIWTQDDLNLLMVLANQAALAIENARFHEAEEQKVVERERDQMALDISGAVSHQYSNRIQVIENLCWQAMSWLEQVLKKGEFDLTKLTRVLRVFESIRKECARAGEIAKGVMSLAKTIPAEFQPAEISPMVRDAIEFVLFKHARGKVVEEAEVLEIVNGISPNLPKISCNSAQIHDSIMNVIDNAVDAIEDRIRKMRLKVLPEPAEPYHGRVVVKAQAENGKVVITVEDNGIGIKEPDKKKIFVPLFTTKGSSQGMGPGGHGLGLFYIKRILMAHGGRISVESEYGKGTCCTIHLPALKEDKASHAA